jgi:hypothetical protein
MTRNSDDLLANYGQKSLFFGIELGPTPRTQTQSVVKFPVLSAVVWLLIFFAHPMID